MRNFNLCEVVRPPAVSHARLYKQKFAGRREKMKWPDEKRATADGIRRHDFSPLFVMLMGANCFFGSRLSKNQLCLTVCYLIVDSH